MILKDFTGAIPVYASYPKQGLPEEELLESIVKIKTQGSSGTGVIISSDGQSIKLLTAAHVVEGSSPQEILVETINGMLISADAIDFFDNTDLAEISSSIAPSTCLKAPPLTRSLSFDIWAKTRDSSFQKDVYIVGYPEATNKPKLVKANAIMQSYSGNPRSGGYSIFYNYENGSNTETGMSGAPVLDRNGYIVGIHGQVDTISLQSRADTLRTGYGLAVPINTWINQRAKSLQVKTRENAVDLALVGAYQLSSGNINQSINSLTEAIQQAKGEYRKMQIKKKRAYIKEVSEPFKEALSAETRCHQEAQHKQEMRSLYPSPYFLESMSHESMQREIEFCIRSARKMKALADERFKLEQTNDEAVESSMAFHGSQHHLYALRALAYAANGQADKSQKDVVKCLKLTGNASARSKVCRLSSKFLRDNNR